MLSQLVVGELLDAGCLVCSGRAPGFWGLFFGGAGSAAGSQDAPESDSDVPPCSAGGAPASPSGGDIASDVALGLGSDAALETAAHVAGASGAAGGMLSVLGAVVSGSQSFAEGMTAIKRNGGRGLGGSSCGGKSSMDAAMAEISGTGSAVK